MEVGLVGAVLYHALNGVRIMLVDFWAKGAALPAADAVDRSSVRLARSLMIPGAVYFMLQRTDRSRCSGARR